jgi:mono/diheme cytochrome c family protein
MRRGVMVAALFVALPFGLGAQMPPASAQPATFNPTQHEGLRLFSQSCGVCHTVVQQRTRQYGPVLSRDTLGGDDELISEYIRNGTPRMPGFRYYFDPEQVNAVVAYIKTIPPQPAPAGAR